MELDPGIWQVHPTILILIAVRTAIIYVLLVFLVRASGKREMAQLTPFDLVLLLLLSNAVQNAMTGPDSSLLGGVVAAVTLLGLNKIVSMFGYWSPFFRYALEGEPTPLVIDGVIQDENMRDEGFTRDELFAALRQQGLGSVKNCQLAMLEVDGGVSVIRKGEEVELDHHVHRRHKLTRHTKRPN